MPDHIHILIGMRPNQSVSELARLIKANSSKWINTRKFLKVKFVWQEGFGGFSYSKSQVKEVIQYIKNQEIHHKTKTFQEEYIAFLEKFEVDYDARYILKKPGVICYYKRNTQNKTK